MILKKISIFTLVCLATVGSVSAQDDHIRSFSDSTRSSILHATERIYQQLDSIKFVNAGEKNVDHIVFDIEDVNLVRRLNALQREVSLNYNAQVRNYIDLYSTKRYQGHLSKMMGLGQYYFPIFEKALQEHGVPPEIKYLAIVESALNPHAVSHMGATGPWQFMYGTAKGYDLTMNNYIDERKDPYAASYAAARYMKDAYAEFGDWLMAIASYNCGKGNIKRALAKCAKFNPTFWDIAPFLPRETRNYVPAFIAMTYMFGYADIHQITPPAESALNLFTETLFVEKFVPLADLAKALAIPVEKLKLHNPAYKKHIVNGTAVAPKRLIIPKEGSFRLEDLYVALEQLQTAEEEEVLAKNDDVRVARVKAAPAMRSHQVRRGETLGAIANKYGVTIQDLKAWNGLRSAQISIGQQLSLKAGEVSPRVLQKAKGNTAKYVIHTVRKGDTLSEIASSYKGATVRQIKADNSIRGNLLKPGTKLKINKG